MSMLACSALAKVKMWEVFPEAEDGSLIWCDEFDYTGQLHVTDCDTLLFARLNK